MALISTMNCRSYFAPVLAVVISGIANDVTLKR